MSKNEIMVFVKPAPARKPRHPTTNERLDRAGSFLPPSAALSRLLRDGDVVKAPVPNAPAKAKKPAKK